MQFFLVVLFSFTMFACGADSKNEGKQQREEITTNPPSFIGQNMAKVSGVVKGINADLNFPYFEVGTVPELESPFREGTIMSQREQGGGGIFTGILKKVANPRLGGESLHPSTTYYYRMCVWSGANEPQNPSHTVCGTVLHFTTAPAIAQNEMVIGDASPLISHDGINRSADSLSTATGIVSSGKSIGAADNIRNENAAEGFGSRCGFIFGSAEPLNCSIGYTAQINLPAHSQIGRVELWHVGHMHPQGAGFLSCHAEINIGGSWITILSGGCDTGGLSMPVSIIGAWTNVSAIRVLVSVNINGGDGIHPSGVSHTTYALKAFDTTLPHLTLVKSGTGSGAIAGGKVNCSSDNCEVELYDRNTPISRLAIAGNGSVFTGWTTGPCAGSTSIACSFILTADTTITAHFDPTPR